MSTTSSNQILRGLFNNSGKSDTDRQRIFDLFFKPLLLYLYQEEKQENWEQLLEQIFCTDTRKIVCGYAKVRFKMPGLYCKYPHKGIAGYGPRDVTKGRPLIIRMDTVLNQYDVQYGDDKEEYFFRLTRSEFSIILDKVELLEDKANKLKEDKKNVIQSRR